MLIHPLEADMPAPDPDCRDFLSRAAKRSSEHPCIDVVFHMVSLLLVRPSTTISFTG